MKAKEVSLIDLMLEILLHWRKIIVLALAGGIFFGGAGYIRSYQNAQEQRAQLLENEAKKEQLAAQLAGDQTKIYEANKEQMENQLTEIQLYNVNAALIYEQIYQDRIAYQEDSILMKMDANRIPKVQLVFLIKTDDENKAGDIRTVYENLIYGGELSTFIATKCGMEESAVDEIVALNEDIWTNEGDIEVAVDQGNRNVFSISLAHYDEGQCEILASALIDFIKDRQKNLQQILGTHEVVLVSQSFLIVKNMDIMNRQRNYLNDIASTGLSAANLKDAFSDREWQYYNFMVENKLFNNKEDVKTEKGSTSIDSAKMVPIISPRVNIKYVVIGMILTVLAYVFIVAVSYVLSDRLKFEDDFQGLYGIPKLGHIPKHRKNRFGGFIDKWLYSLRDKNKRVFTMEEMVKLIAVAVKMVAKSDKLDTIYMVGCSIGKEGEFICEQIKGILEGDLSIRVLDNILYSAESMEELGASKGVVLVEKAGLTLYTEICTEIELLQRQNIKILGGIIVE